MFRRFGISSRNQRITLSIIALALALLIGFLKGQPGAARDSAPSAMRSETSEVAPRPGQEPQAPQNAKARPKTDREQAVAKAVRWLKAQEGGKHRGHAISRHVGKSDKQLRQRLERDNKSVVSGFYDLETAAVAIVRTIRHKENDSRVRRWLGDKESKRRLALRRAFEKPVGRIVYRDGGARDGNGVVAVLTKWQSKGKTSYRLLTAYVER